MKHIYITVGLVILLSTAGFSQKVKYKNLFILLKAENYDDADVYLRAFLINEPDHPDANYRMGKMLQEYVEKENLLTNSAQAILIADSSVKYLKKSLNLLTEKYVIKQHDDDYYAEFRRRNLRTGKFEVKLSDVQLDIEERAKSLTQFIADVRKFKVHFNTSISYYDSCIIQYNELAAKAETMTKLYFTTTPEDLQFIRRLATSYDSSLYNFNTYRAIMKGLGKSAINQSLVEKVIEDYPGKAGEEVDFYATSVVLYNFKDWANAVNDKILKQILPLKKRIVKFDQRVSELHDRIIRDSLDSRPEVFRLAIENVGNDIDEYHANSLPSALYNYRIGEINFHSAVNFWYAKVADTLDVGVKLDLLVDFDKQFKGINQLLESLRKANNPTNLMIFRDYVSEIYTDKAGVDAFINGQSQEVRRDGELVESWGLEAEKEDKKTLWDNGSIPLIVGEEIINRDSVKYSTVMIDSLGYRNVGFYSLREDINSVSLTYGISPSSRVLDTLYSVLIDPLLVEQRLINLNYLADSVGTGQRVWVLNTTVPDSETKFKTQIFLTHLEKGTAWQTTLDLPKAARVLLIDDEKQEIKVLGDEDQVLVVLNISGDILEENETADPGQKD